MAHSMGKARLACSNCTEKSHSPILPLQLCLAFMDWPCTSCHGSGMQVWEEVPGRCHCLHDIHYGLHPASLRPPPASCPLVASFSPHVPPLCHVRVCPSFSFGPSPLHLCPSSSPISSLPTPSPAQMCTTEKEVRERGNHGPTLSPPVCQHQ